MKRIPSSLAPTPGSVLFAALLALVFLLGPRTLNVDGDLGRHITIGSYMLDHLSIPAVDLFSHTRPGLPLIQYEWLAQALLALSYRLFNLSGPVLLEAACVGISGLLVYNRALRESGSPLAALLCSFLGIAAARAHWLPRPHLFTILLLPVWIIGLDHLRRGVRGRIPTWIWMPAIMVVWVNLHGGFIAAFAVMALMGMGYLWDRWVEKDTADFAPGFGAQFSLVTATSLTATLLHPSGAGLWGHILGTLGNSYLTGNTEEFFSPDFHNTIYAWFLLMLLLGLSLFGLSGRRQRASDLLWFCAWAGMSLISLRNIPLFVIVAVPVLAKAMKEAIERLGQKNKLFSGLNGFDLRRPNSEPLPAGMVWPAVALLAAVLLVANGVGRDANRFSPNLFPVDAVTWLEDHPQQGEVFNYFPWGGYLLYRDWPHTRVFIDGQTDFYGAQLFSEYFDIVYARPGWEDLLQKHSIDWVIVPPDSRLANEIPHLNGWREIYRDRTAVIFRLDP